jgi:hypothetical protein
MKYLARSHTVAAMLIGLVPTGFSPNAWAGIHDYELQLVQSEIKQAGEAVIAVRLVDKRSGASVPDAVIFTQRMDMAPDGMETMVAPIDALPSTEPGVYRFKGGWRLSLGAKVQGEIGTLKGELVFRVVP